MVVGNHSASLLRGCAFHLPHTQRPVPKTRRRFLTTARGSADDKESESLLLLEDPEAPLRRYGSRFGQKYQLRDVVDSAPRVRIRRAKDRARDQLADLAVVNERLALQDEAEAAAVRQRVDYLRRKRQNWELIYEHVTRNDAVFTLGAIEEANRRVEAALDEGARERVGVGALKRRLTALQGEVTAAHSRLHVTQARVEANLQRIAELKEEARRLEEVHGGGLDPIGRSAAAGGSARDENVGANDMNMTLEAPTALPLSGEDDISSRSTGGALHGTTAGKQSAAIFSSSSVSHTSSLPSRRRRGLESSLTLEDALKNHWYAVQFSSHLDHATLVPFELFDQPWVLFRGVDGAPACVRDECAHRACPLSLGSVVGGEVQCPYHGWRFDGGGRCTTMPSTAFCSGVSVSALPVVEMDGLIYVWPGWQKPSPPPTGAAAPPKGYQVHAEIELEVPVEHGLLLENLLDLAHAPFTHTSTFAKGWPVPEAVRFHASRLLSGSWQPYPIDMSFGPPCMVFSTIGLQQPGRIERGARAADCRNHLHQMHVCLPARQGHTRLLYRMSLDFMGWSKFVPGIQRFWESIAGQVLGEDLVLVKGQQDRLLRGGDTWAHPVSYDKLGVRYRRWRNAMAHGNAMNGQAQSQSGVGSGLARAFSMDAGQLFSVDEEDEDGEVSTR